MSAPWLHETPALMSMMATTVPQMATAAPHTASMSAGNLAHESRGPFSSLRYVAAGRM